MRWARVLKWFFGCLGLVIGLVATSLTVLFGTESGRLWLAERATSLAEKSGISLELTELRTPHLSEWRASKLVVVRNGESLVEVDHLEFSWSPSALLKRHILIRRTAAAHIIYHHFPGPQASEEESGGSFSPPSVRITLQDLSIEKFDLLNLDVTGKSLPSYKIEGNADVFGPEYPLQLQLLVASLGTEETHLQIDTQAISSREVRFQGTFKEAPGGLLGSLSRWPQEQAIDLNFAAKLRHDDELLRLGLEDLRVSLSGHALTANGDLTYVTNSRSLTINELLVDTDGNQHRLRGSYSPLEIRAAVDLSSFPLGLLHPWVPDLKKGFASGAIELHWLLQEEGRWPDIAADAEATVTYQNQTYQADIHGRLADKLLSLQPSVLRIGNTKLEAQGQLDLLGEQSDVRGEVLWLDDKLLRSYQLPIPEELTVKAERAIFSVRGSIRDPSIKVDTRLDGNYHGRDFSLAVSGTGTQRSANLTNAHLVAGTSEAKASGRIDWAGASTNAHLQFENLDQDLLQLLPEQVVASVPDDLSFSASGSMQISGDLRRPKVQTQSVVTGIYALPEERLPYRLTLDGAVQVGKLADLTMALQRVELTLFDSPALVVDGHYSASDMNLHLHMNNLPTQTLAALGWHRVNGEAEADVRIEGSLQHPIIEGFLEYRDHLPGANRRRVPVTMRLELTTVEEQLRLLTTFNHNNELAGNLVLSLPLGAYLQAKPQQELPLNLDAEGEWDLRFLRLFADLGIHRIEGKIATDLNVRGTAAAPEFTGRVQLLQGTYNNSVTGSLLEDIQLTLEGDGQTVILKDGRARSGDDGHLSLGGHIHWQEEKRSQQDAVGLTLRADNVMLVQRRDLQGEIEGELNVTGSFQELWVNGELEISPLNASVESAISTQIPEIRVTEVNSGEQKTQSDNLPVVNLDITVVAERQAYLRGRGLDTELGGRVSIRGTASNPEYHGLFTTRRGRIDLFGKRFILENGQVQFNNDGVILRIPATYTTDELTINAELYGTAEEPKLKLTSVPARPEDEVLSQLIFGKSVQDITAFEAIRLAGAVRTLSSGGGFDPVNSARQMLGVDTLTIDNTSTQEGSGVSVGVGKYINEKVYLEIKRSPNPTQPWNGSVQIELSPKLTLQSGTSENGGAGAELLWKRDY